MSHNKVFCVIGSFVCWVLNLSTCFLLERISFVNTHEFILHSAQPTLNTLEQIYKGTNRASPGLCPPNRQAAGSPNMSVLTLPIEVPACLFVQVYLSEGKAGEAISNSPKMINTKKGKRKIIEVEKCPHRNENEALLSLGPWASTRTMSSVRYTQCSVCVCTHNLFLKRFVAFISFPKKSTIQRLRTSLLESWGKT